MGGAGTSGRGLYPWGQDEGSYIIGRSLGEMGEQREWAGSASVGGACIHGDRVKGAVSLARTDEVGGAMEWAGH